MLSFLIWSTLLIAFGQSIDSPWKREIADEEVLRISKNALNDRHYWVTKGEYILGTEEDDAIGDDFTSEMSKDGNIIVYGAPTWSNNKGKVVVMEYDESSESWKQKGKTLEGDAEGSKFGATCSISGDGSVIAIGSKNEYAWIFQWDESNSEYTIKGDIFDNDDGFGYVGKTILVSNDGDSVLIGYGGSSNSRMGMFDYDNMNNIWVRRGDWIQSSGEDCAYAISMARETKDKVAMYCYEEEKSWAYAWNSESEIWEETGAFDAPHGLSIDVQVDDYWGQMMSMSDDGTYLMMTAYYMYDPEKNTDETYIHGGFQVVEWNGMNWFPHGSIVFGMADDAEAGYYGAAMSRDGSTVCMSQDSPSYVVTCHEYDEEEGDWRMKGLPLVLDSEEHRFEETHIGEAMSLSEDGNVLSFGAPDLSTPDIENRGAVVVMKWHENFLTGTRSTKRVLNLHQLLDSGNSMFKWNRIQMQVGKLVYLEMDNEDEADAVTAFSSWYQYTRQDYSESNFNDLKDAVDDFVSEHDIVLVKPATTLWHDYENPNFRRKM